VKGWRRLRARVGPRSEAPPLPAPRERSSATEFFFEDAPDRPLIVVVHIAKTAGTALRRFVRGNLADAEVEVIHNLRYLARNPAERLEWFRDWYSTLEVGRRARLSCVMSHWAGYLLPALDREADALTLVREPVDRTLSYYFHKQRQHPEWSLDTLERLAEERSAPDWRSHPRAELLDRLFDNWQSRVLLAIFHDVSTLESLEPEDGEAEMWRERLRELAEDVFTIGVQDRFDAYAGLLARRYGWLDAAVRRAKVNPHRPASPVVSATLREAVLAHNWLDCELHRLATRAQLEREARALEPVGRRD
jgi:hypothetical protein